MASAVSAVSGLEFEDDDVVITGLSGRFPLADNVQELKENLFSKRNCVINAEERWSSDLPGCPSNKMGIIKSLDKFDAEFFGMDVTTADSEDPQNRMLFEVSYETIIDSGYDPEELRGKHIGVFIGESDPDPISLERNITGDTRCKNTISYIACMAANKLSRKYGFTGPSFAVDTACSSSGVALEDAFRRLKAGTIEAAIVGGSSLCLDPRSNASYLAMGILSSTGESCSFDAKANGMVKAESIATIFLQKKKDARRIYAKIHNIECTSAGFVPEGVFVPNVKAEAHLFQKTYDRIGMDPSLIGYVEGHGTSTAVGDPTEVNAIEEVFCKNREKPLLLGALKSNIGHTEATSAICGIAKDILAFESGMIPPNINFETPNPNCPALSNGKIEAVTEVTPYDNPLMGFNNFGFGGVSIHMIMERNRIEKKPDDETATEKIPKLVVYAATTEKALTDMFDYFKNNSMPKEFFALLNKSAYIDATIAPYRGFTILKNDSSAITSVERCVPTKRQVWYVLTGMGCQWSGMGLDLMQLDVFAESMTKSAKVLERFGIDLLELLQPNKNYLQRDRHITPAFVTIAAIQIALVDVLKSLGLEPDGIVGHSTGELVCSYADGCCTAEQTILSAYYRGAAVECTELPAGAMAAVGLTWEEATKRCPEGVFPACHNAEDSVTISGSKEAVEKFVEQLKSENTFARIVNAYGYAFHCETISAVTKTLRKHLLEVYSDPKPRSKRWLSSSYCEDEWNDPISQTADANYFCHNLESQVHFREVLNHIPADAITIEIGPHFLLQSILKRAIGSKAAYIGLMKRNENNVDFLLSSIGKLYNLGLKPKVENLYSPVSFPVPRGTPMISSLIQWNHSYSYYVPKYSSLVGKSKSEAKTTSTDSFLLDHCIEGRSLYPATGYIYLAWKTFAESLNKPMENLPICIENFKILRATVLSSKEDKCFEVSLLNMKGDFEIIEDGATVSTGKIYSPLRAMFGDEARHYERSKSSLVISGQEIYNELKIHGYEYGPSFQGLLEINMEGTSGLVKWNDEWISFLDSLFLFFGIIYENSEFKLPRSALSIKIDPTLHAKFVTSMEQQGLEGVPVTYDQHVRKCTAPGVEIRNLKLEPAPHRLLSEIMPVVEEYSFVPYHEKSVLSHEEMASCDTYVQVCCHLAKQIADRLNIKGQVQSILQSVKLNRDIDIPAYLKALTEDQILLKTIQRILETCDSPELASEINAEYISDALAKDTLFKAILNEKPLRSLIDVVVENCIGKMIVAECSVSNSLLLPAVQDTLKSFSIRKASYNLIPSEASKIDVEDLNQRGIMVETATQNRVALEKLSGSCDIGLISLMLDSSDNLSSRFRNVCSLVKDGGFVLVVHKHKLTPPELFLHVLSKMSFTIHSEEAVENMFSEEKMIIVSKKSGAAGFNVYLLRKVSSQMQSSRIHVVKILDGKYEQWVSELKKAMVTIQKRNNSDKVLLVAQNTPTSGIIGLVNCLKHEPGGDKIRCIFTDSSAPSFDLKKCFYEEVFKNDLLMNVHINGTWGSFRHTSLTGNTPQDTVLCASIECAKLGDLSSFKWVESPVKHTRSPECTNELYHVYYASLNFRDVMMATGKIPLNSENGHGTNSFPLGMEFSGRDKNGRRIMAMTNGGCFSNAVVGKHPLVTFDVPDHWSLEEAATVPVVYSTCYFALIIKGKLQESDKVLIHCGTGGIGQAAIRIALSMDCEIFTTVGTPEKRSFLLEIFPQLKPENIGCSRDTSFEEMIMKQTKGQGVDVVLNSLSGDKLQASVRCLTKHGRFLELGKYDFVLNNTLGLRIFLKDVSFHGIQLHTSYNGSKKTSQFINRTKELLIEGIRKGVVQPLNTTIFSINDIEKAFRYMGSGKHTGKVLLKVRNEESKKIVVPPPLKVTALKKFSLSSNKSYIIIGGLGGFGIELAKWMVQKGAGAVILTSRHGPRTPYHHLCLKRWKDSGERVLISTLNVAKRDEAEKLLKETAGKYGPVGGIFNLAVVLRDAFIENQTASYFEDVSAPKALATKHLDQLTRKMCPELDMFVCFSSISSGKGNAGQTNYGYSNSVMEKICEQRKRDGLHGLAIQWGAFSEVGLTQRNRGEDSMIPGVMPQKIKSCLQYLERFLLQDKPVVSSFVSGSKSTIKKRPVDVLRQMTTLFDVDEINPSCTFGQMGLDSVASMELQQLMESYFDVQFTLQEILDMKLDDVKKLAEVHQQNKEELADQSKDFKNVVFNGPSIAPPTETITELNTGKTGDPIFLLHGNGSVHDNLRKLAENVSRPVFGLQSTKGTPVRSLKDMAVWHLKQIQKICSDRSVHLVSVSTVANLALEMALRSQNQKDLYPSIGGLIIVDGATSLMEAYTTTEEEKKQNASVYEASDLCEFLSAFSDSDLTQLEAQLKLLPTLESRVNMVSGLLDSTDKSAFIEGAEFYLTKQNLMRSHEVTEVLQRDITVIEASEKLLPNNVAPLKSLLQQICSGRVVIHRIPGRHELLSDDSRIGEVSKLLNKM